MLRNLQTPLWIIWLGVTILLGLWGLYLVINTAKIISQQGIWKGNGFTNMHERIAVFVMVVLYSIERVVYIIVSSDDILLTVRAWWLDFFGFCMSICIKIHLLALWSRAAMLISSTSGLKIRRFVVKTRAWTAAGITLVMLEGICVTLTLLIKYPGTKKQKSRLVELPDGLATFNAINALFGATCTAVAIVCVIMAFVVSFRVARALELNNAMRSGASLNGESSGSYAPDQFLEDGKQTESSQQKLIKIRRMSIAGHVASAGLVIRAVLDIYSDFNIHFSNYLWVRNFGTTTPFFFLFLEVIPLSVLLASVIVVQRTIRPVSNHSFSKTSRMIIERELE